MKDFFVDVLKFSLFIGLGLAAAYFTGHWDTVLRLAKTVADESIVIWKTLEANFGTLKQHFS
jgi:hypothetical protein